MNNIFEKKDILVTGGCGSIGSEVVRQLITYNPKRIRVFDNNESGHFHLNQKCPSPLIRNLIGDIRDRERVFRAMEDVDIVFHAAALKHVPFCEYNPFEAVLTNVMGTKNVLEGAIDRGIQKFVGISTDKAVHPFNTMGATKLLSERLVINAPLGKSEIKLACVRFGNVLDSVGSVIPIFRHQIAQGGPVTITSEQMTRFFMTIPEAVKLILAATTQMTGREIFILKMNAVRITDLAQVLINELAPRHGFKPADIPIRIIGVRAGEKVDEALFTDEEAPYVSLADNMYVLRNSEFDNMRKIHNTFQTGYVSSKIDLLKPAEISRLLYDSGII